MILQFNLAEVAELVDALDSKSSAQKNVRVRVSPSVPEKIMNEIQLITAQSSSFLGPQLILIGGFFFLSIFLSLDHKTKE